MTGFFFMQSTTYTNALARLKAKSKELFKDMLSAEEMKKMR